MFLTDIHANGMVHEDIKPGNILIVTKDGKAHGVVIDYGSFQTVNSSRPNEGTGPYNPPEGPQSTRQRDCYAAAVTLKQLVYGSNVLRPPTPGHSLHEQVREGLIPGDPIDDVILGLSSEDPAERMTAAAALERVTPIIAGMR